MYTWGEIQIETCKKMFLNSDKITTADLDTLRDNNNYKTYFNAMAQAANEGIAEILKRGKPYLKTLNFTSSILDNLLGDNFAMYEHLDEDIEFETIGGLAYSFMVDDPATVKIYVNDVLVNTINHTDKRLFKTYKGFLSNSDGHKVKLVFEGAFPYSIKNVCIYKNNYDYDNTQNISNIPLYFNENKITIDDILDTNSVSNGEWFYKIYKIYKNGKELINNTDYRMIDYHTISFKDRVNGDYYILYQPYVGKITEETSDDYVLPLEYETVVLLPLYMASQLYKDDDLSLSTIYRNEFEAAIDDTYPTMSDLKFTDKAGWL